MYVNRCICVCASMCKKFWEDPPNGYRVTSGDREQRVHCGLFHMFLYRAPNCSEHKLF